MVKDKSEKPEKASKSPAKIMQDAMELDDPIESSDSDVPVIDLDASRNPNVILDGIKRTVLNDSKYRVQKNLAAAAVADSEFQRIESERRRESLMNSPHASQVSSNHPPSITMPGGGGLFPVVPINDRVSLIKATLSTFSSDEARAKWIEEHRDWFESPNPVLPSFGRRDTQPKNESNGVANAFDQVGDIFFKSLNAGMELQKGISGSSNTSPSINATSPIDLINIIANFKEMQENTTKAFSASIDGVAGILKSVNEEHAKERAKFQDDLLNITKERYEETTKLMEKIREDKEARLDREISELKDRLNSPPQVTVSDIKSIVSQARDSGVPITTVTPEREAIQEKAKLERDKWEHETKMEERKAAIELARVNQKTALFSAFAGGLGAAFGPSLTKKHNPSDDAKSVSSRL